MTSEKDALIVIERMPGNQGFCITWHFNDEGEVPAFYLNSQAVRMAINIIVEACMESAA